MFKHAILALIAILAGLGPAAADVGISPLRQVLDENHREARFVVSNPTKRILNGRARWLDLAATPTGYRRAKASERPALSAAPYLTLSPAQFRLEPGARIEIVLRVKDGAILPGGERRSHLLIETAAARTLIRKASDTGLQVDIGAGVSAPVIVRGAGGARAKIASTRLLRDQEGMLLLSTTIEQVASHSSFGRLRANFQPADGAESRQIAIRDNVAGYLDASTRIFELPLGYFSLGHGALTLTYEGADEYEGVIFDERQFEISPSE